MTSTFSRAFGGPNKYIQGPGEFNNLELLTKEFGSSVLCVIDGFLFENFSKKLADIYAGTDSTCQAVSFGGECCQEEIDRLCNQIKDMNANVIVGVGGGKTLDTTKFVANTLSIPRILVPTSASTDAPTSGLAVLYTKEGEHAGSHKMSRNSELILMDSEIIVNAPVRLFVAGMGDALATYLEAKANAATESPNFIGKGYRRCRAAMAIARESFDILLEDGVNALRAVKRKVVTEEVENVIEANTLLSGLGFENTGCACAHGIHAGITAVPSAHKFLHGEKVAFGIVCQLVLENTPNDEVDKIMKFMIDVGLPVSLPEINVEETEENVRKIAQHTVNKNPLIHNEPVFITEDLVCSVIWAANDLGKAYLAKYKA